MSCPPGFPDFQLAFLEDFSKFYKKFFSMSCAISIKSNRNFFEQLLNNFKQFLNKTLSG